MGNYKGPKGRVNRRLGMAVFENVGAMRTLERREYPPGMAQRRRKLSTYGLAMREKQRIKYYYGLRERQLRRYFDRVKSMKGNTGEQLLILCERRLDNVVRRAGFAHTRPQARQAVAHSHFKVNGQTVSVPSIQLRAGDVVTVRNRPNLQALYRSTIESSNTEPCNWLAVDRQKLEITVTSLPITADISLPVDVGQVVAFMSR
jgi:small subunit ribosomal protein S4